MQKLGAAADQAALQQKNPRKDLKLLTTKPGFGFQLVNKDELQQFIAPKAADQHGAVISSKKKQKPRKQERAGPSSRLPDPQQIQILPGHFVDTDQDQVVPMSADVTNARGNAVCSKMEALPYSTDALALLVLESEDTPVDQRGRALISTLRI